MSLITKLATLFTGGFVTVTDATGTPLTKADALAGLALSYSAANTVVAAVDGGQIAGQLKAVDPKGDLTVTMAVTGFLTFPVASASQASVAVGNAVTGYVIGAGSGEVKVLATATVGTTASVLELLVKPLKVVEVLNGGTHVVVDMGAKIS